MSFSDKQKLAKKLKIDFTEEHTEADLDELIKLAEDKKAQEAEENRIAKENEKKLAESKKSPVVLKDIDGNEVDQADYFWPRTKEEKLPDGKTLPVTDQTAPAVFNKQCGLPVDREELIEVFKLIFPKSKKFLFYKVRDKELYLVIVPLTYARTVTSSNEARPGDFQKHGISFITEGSVNIDSLKSKLTKVANHASISKEPLA